MKIELKLENIPASDPRFGEMCKQVLVERIEEMVICLMLDLSEDERVKFLDNILKDFCRYCGSKTAICHCRRDD